MAIEPHTFLVPFGKPVTIYAETNNINFFLANDLEPDGKDPAQIQAASVSGFTRRQYPGDESPIAVASHTREFMVDPTSRKGRALPGKQFVLKQKADPLTPDVFEQRTFTYRGRWMDLVKFLRAEAPFDMTAYNHTGRSVKIEYTSNS